MSGGPTTADILADLNRAKVVFQQRAILAAMGVTPACKSCGDPTLLCDCRDVEAQIGVAGTR